MGEARMTDQPTLFDEPRDHAAFYRQTDAEGSRKAGIETAQAHGSTATVRKGSQKFKLLMDAKDFPAPAIDRERAVRAGLPARSCWWHRIGDLEDAGYLMVADEDGYDPETGKSSLRRTTITVLGMAKLREIA